MLVLAGCVLGIDVNHGRIPEEGDEPRQGWNEVRPWGATSGEGPLQAGGRGGEKPKPLRGEG